MYINVTNVRLFVPLLSLLFTVAVISVYACLPQLRNLHGKLLICYLATYFISSTILLSKNIGINIPSLLYPILEVSLRSSLTYLSILCFDIWQTFRRLGQRSHSTQFSHLLTYILLGLFHPLFMISIDRCDRNYVTDFFLFTLQIVLNVLLFLFTLCNICLARFGRDDHLGKEAVQGLLLCARLALLMGFDWTVLLVSMYTDSDWIANMTDMIFRSKGILVFVFFICNERVLGSLCKRSPQRATGQHVMVTENL